jgi:hypothetical protein
MAVIRCTKMSVSERPLVAYGKLVAMGNSHSRPIAFFVICSGLSGCAPYWEHYQRVEAPEAVMEVAAHPVVAI